MRERDGVGGRRALRCAAAAALLLGCLPRGTNAGLSSEKFNSMTERDIEKIAEEWDKDEEEDPDDPMVKKRKMMESGGGGMDPSLMMQMAKGGGGPDAQKLMWQSKKGQTVMMFIAFNPEIDTKEKALKMTERWTGMLQNGHVEMKPYPIEDNRFIYILDDGAMVPVALDVLKQQPEFNYAEIDSQKYFGLHSHLKTHPEEEKKEELRIKTRDEKIRAKQKWPKVVEMRGKGKPGVKRKDTDDAEKKKKKKKKTTKKKKNKGKKTAQAEKKTEL